MEVSYREMNFEDVPENFGDPPKENWKNWISNRKRTLVLFSVVAVLIALACTIVLSLTVLNADTDEIGNQNNLNSIKRENMLKYLHQISHTTAYISGVDCLTITYDSIQNISKITKAFPGVVGTFIPRYNASSAGLNTFIENVMFIWNNHHFVKLYLRHDRMFQDVKTIYGSVIDGEEKWKDLMVEGSFLNTKWKEQLDIVALLLQKLQTAGVVPILDILPDIYHYNFIWNGRPGVNGSVKLYRMSKDYLHHKLHCTSVIWAWSINGVSSMSNIDEYWPGDDYVDVVSVYMGTVRQLISNKYQKLVDLVGDKPMSMEHMFFVPPTHLFVAQPRWTWFTATYHFLAPEFINPIIKVQATFNSISVINAGNITYFDITN